MALIKKKRPAKAGDSGPSLSRFQPRLDEGLKSCPGSVLCCAARGRLEMGFSGFPRSSRGGFVPATTRAPGCCEVLGYSLLSLAPGEAWF